MLVTALLAGGASGGLIYVRNNRKTVVDVTSVSELVTDYYYSDTEVEGTITTNAIQSISMDSDMIIQEVHVNTGDSVSEGDPLITFDMTLVQMELTIAQLKLQQQEENLETAQKRLTSLQNGGPIEDTTSSDTISVSGSDPDSSSGSSDDDMESVDDLASLSGSSSGGYLAFALSPVLLTAFTDSAEELGDESSDTLTDESSSDTSQDTTTDSSSSDSLSDSADDSSINFTPSYQDSSASTLTDGTSAATATPTPTPASEGITDGASTLIDGEETFYQVLDYSSEPFTGTGTEEDPHVFLCSSAKGYVTVQGSFFNRMAGYSEDGSTVEQEGGSWFLLEFHQNDTIADYQDRKASCTGYYLIDGSLLANPVYMYAEVEFSLADASLYETETEDEEATESDASGSTSSSGSSSSTMTREEAIKAQQSTISSLELDIQESNLDIAKLEKKLNNETVYARIDGVVTYVGDVTTGSYSGDAFLKVKSKNGYYVTGSVSELMLDQIEVGTILSCVSYDIGSFEAEVVDVADYPSSSDSSYYFGDSNPNASYYTFQALVTDTSLTFSDLDYISVTLPSAQLEEGSLVVLKSFVRTENGNSYVWKDQNGTLVKQYVTVWETVNSGYYVIVKGGLTTDDLLAFPYGDDLQEGVLTNEVTLDEMYDYE